MRSSNSINRSNADVPIDDTSVPVYEDNIILLDVGDNYVPNSEEYIPVAQAINSSPYTSPPLSYDDTLLSLYDRPYRDVSRLGRRSPTIGMINDEIDLERRQAQSTNNNNSILDEPAFHRPETVRNNTTRRPRMATFNRGFQRLVRNGSRVLGYFHPRNFTRRGRVLAYDEDADRQLAESIRDLDEERRILDNEEEYQQAIRVSAEEAAAEADRRAAIQAAYDREQEAFENLVYRKPKPKKGGKTRKNKKSNKKAKHTKRRRIQKSKSEIKNTKKNK